MWTRAELKDKAKAALKRNYWKAVLIAVIIMLIGDAMVAGGMSGSLNFGTDNSIQSINGDQTIMDKIETFTDEYESSELNIGDGFARVIVLVLLRIGVGAGLAVLIGSVFTLLYNILLVNPLAVGTRKFFSNSLESKASLKDVVSVFKNNYWNNVKIMLIVNIKIIFWSLLFCIPAVIGAFIPGIGQLIMIFGVIAMGVLLVVKMYDYMMVPYILNDNPDISTDAVFAESKRLIEGEKWNVFVLDLSFIGWNLLSSLTFGLLSVFFVGPYQCYTYAALYHKLSDKEAPFANKDYDDIFENSSGEALFEDM